MTNIVNRSPEGDPPGEVASPAEGVITLDRLALREWLGSRTSLDGYGLPRDWIPAIDDVTFIVDELDAGDTALARRAWRRSPLLRAACTFAVRSSGSTRYLFGLDTIHGGRICTLPVGQADLERRVAGIGVDAAEDVVTHVVALMNQCVQRATATCIQLAGKH